MSQAALSPPADSRDRGPARHDDPPRRRRQDPGQHAHRGALARAVAPHEGHRGAGGDRQVEPGDGPHAPVLHDEALGHEPDRPARFEGIEALPKRVHRLAADARAVKAYIAQHCDAASA